MKNDSLKLKIIFALIFFTGVFLLPKISSAKIYFVDKILAADCALGNYSIANRNCAGSDGNAYTNLYNPNTKMIAGDTTYIRGGIYNIGTYAWNNYTNPGIIPSYSGTSATARITYSNYNGESVIFDGKREEAPWSYATYINGKSWIYISGIKFQNFKFFLQIVNGSHHNEIANSTFDNFYPRNYTGITTVDYGGSVISGSSQYNYIHHSTFSRYGGQTVGPGYYDGAYPFSIGAVFSAAPTDQSYYNVIENNAFFAGGHAVLNVSSRYNIIRNNEIRHELWLEIPAGSGVYVGYHVMQVSGPEAVAGYNLIENNIMAFGAENLNPQNYAGSGLKLVSQHNIIRFNDIIGNWNSGINIRAYGLIEGPSYSNYPYNNSIYNNSFLGNGRHPAMYNGSAAIPGKMHSIDFDIAYDPANSAGTHPPIKQTEGYDKIYGNNVKNNLMADVCQASPYLSSISTQNEWWYQNLSNEGPCSNDPEGADACVAYQNISHNWDTCLGKADPKYTNTILSAYNSLTQVLPDLTLQANSPVIDQGTYLARAQGSGNNSNSLRIDDAKYFFDGKFGSASGLDPSQWPLTVLVQADWIAVGNVNNVAQISAIDYGANTIILSTPLIWTDNAPVWLYKDSSGRQVLYGSAPDYGAYEYAQSAPPSDTTPPAAPSGVIVN